MGAKGKAWKFGDGISTDHIIPGRYFFLRSNLEELAKHAMEDARKDFRTLAKPGDFIVGARNFGQGSSREHAAIVIKMSGIQAVLAKSFARIFFRNCINTGLPAVICDTDKIDEGDELEVILGEGKVINHTKGITLTFPALPPVMEGILEDGGLAAHIQKHGDFKVS